MHISAKILATLAFSGLLGMSQPANAQGCSIEGVVLVCVGAKSADEITVAFADPETSKTLSAPLSKLSLFEKPGDLETFRKSVEKNWRQAKQAEATQRRNMRRRKINPEQFEEWSKTYDAAAANYAKAITFYRTLVWHGKHGKPAPEDAD